MLADEGAPLLSVLAGLAAALLQAASLTAPAAGVPGSVHAMSAPERGFTVGQRLPELVLPTITGDGVVSLSELRGRRLLLVQFASW